MDLSTNYLGMRLKNPIVPSASPLSRKLDGIRKMEDAGASAIVLYSLFEEAINKYPTLEGVSADSGYKGTTKEYIENVLKNH